VAKQAVTKSNLNVHDALPKALPVITLLFGRLQNNRPNQPVMAAISSRCRHPKLKRKLSMGGT
jgi:hypothetical protein